jgi:glycosyltransferase involved in cell wall biosynthesis
LRFLGRKIDRRYTVHRCRGGAHREDTSARSPDSDIDRLSVTKRNRFDKRSPAPATSRNAGRRGALSDTRVEDRPRIRVLRAIARLNIGGPTIHALSLTNLLVPQGYDTVLVRGVEGAREGSMDELAAQLGVRPYLLSALRRDLGVHDLLALVEMTKIIRRLRPHILHTHTAKAGAIGRLAASFARDAEPPVIVHTFHGHILTDYFSPWRSRAFASMERLLALRTTRLIAVSREVRDDLIRLRVAGPTKIEVVPCGLDLRPFQVTGEERARKRAETRRRLGIDDPDADVVTLVARLVPIKAVDRFLRIAERLSDRRNTYFVVVGDGDLREVLQASPPASRLGRRLVWTGFERDMPAIMFASDLVVQTSDNEGTPVSLIEAHAAALPVVSTDVGGVPSVVLRDRSGTLVAPDDEASFAAAARRLLDDPDRGAQYGQTGQRHVVAGFSVEKLVLNVDRLYQRLLAERQPTLALRLAA